MAAAAPGLQERDTAAVWLGLLVSGTGLCPLHPNMSVPTLPRARGHPWVGTEHTPRSGSWKRASTALAPRSGCGAVFTSMLRAVPASSRVSLFRAWTHKGAKAQLKTTLENQTTFNPPSVIMQETTQGPSDTPDAGAAWDRVSRPSHGPYAPFPRPPPAAAPGGSAGLRSSPPCSTPGGPCPSAAPGRAGGSPGGAGRTGAAGTAISIPQLSKSSDSPFETEPCASSLLHIASSARLGLQHVPVLAGTDPFPLL